MIPYETRASIESRINGHTETGFLFKLMEIGHLCVDLKDEYKSREGGCGITGRSLRKMEINVPYIGRMIDETEGKIVFLGNGFSPVPCDLADAGKEVVIADLFDYGAMVRDLERAEQVFKEYGEPFTKKAGLESARRIHDYIQKGSIEFVLYQVGSGNPPKELLDAELIINYFGPSFNTIEEQLSYLSETGQLIIEAKDSRGFFDKPVPLRREHAKVFAKDADPMDIIDFLEEVS